ncbi:hypothetical protein [Nocardia sp. AG03]|uniref:hypothetical protein n=1 Tax=Nocardia sp. AG03 TaxID=3025312 RepID=UPI0024185528|nr:hypothetical protein [Nocardia sp. AG03]
MTRHPRESSNDHLFAKGLSATGLAALFLLLRLFAVTDYDWNAAFSLVGTLGIGDVAAMVLGTLMAAPVLAGCALGILLPAALIHQIALGRPSWSTAGNLTWFITVALFFVSLLWTFRQWWVAVLAVLVGLTLYALVLPHRNRHEHSRFAHWFLRSSVLIVTVAALILATVVQDPWVSLERIHTRNDGVLEGYVMENPPGFLKVLRERGREIVILDVADVTGREEVDPEP